jgi:predicted dehydrogenase
MPDKVRWGIIGTGIIAAKFATGLAFLRDARLVAVGSRTQAAADKFARKFKVAHAHDSYEALVADREVDVFYVATPHTFHAANTVMALEAGKPVLCEKPFTINAGEAEGVIQKAREKKLLLMEAMWTRFLPPIVKLRQLLAKGTVGEVRMLEADFGFRAPKREGRLFDPALGGGALLDVGVYPIALASMLFGPPSRISGMAELGPTGVDEYAAAVLGHPRGQLAVISTALQANTFHEASIVGTKGRIKLHEGWWMGSNLTVIRDGRRGAKLVKVPFKGNGYQFQAIEFMNCLRKGRTESAVMPLDETLSIMKTMDKLRAQWGLRYPME